MSAQCPMIPQCSTWAGDKCERRRCRYCQGPVGAMAANFCDSHACPCTLYRAPTAGEADVIDGPNELGRALVRTSNRRNAERRRERELGVEEEQQ